MITFTLKCSVKPRPLLPKTPNETLSSRNSRSLYFSRNATSSGKGQISPVFM